MIKNKKKFISLKVTVNIPDGCTAHDVQNYVRDAVNGWSGGMDARDPIFQIRDAHVVRIRPESDL